MAYYVDDNEEEISGQGEAPAASTGPQGSGVIGAQSAPTSNTPNPQQSAQNVSSQRPDRASNFVGIQSYLDANKSQAGKLGDDASGVITNSASAARDSVTGLSNKFNEAAGSGVQNDQSLLDRANEAEKLSQQERDRLKNQYTAQYAGPQSLQDYNDEYADTLKKTQTAKSNVQNAGTEAGRQQIITQINNKPRTQGVTGFDSLLLQSGGGREKLEAAAGANKDINDDLLKNANLTAQQKAAEIKAQTDATRTATQSAVGGAMTGFDADLAKRVKAWQDKMVGDSNRLNEDVTDLELYDDTLSAYGLNEGDSTYGLGLKDYLNPTSVTDVNAGNVASAEDYDRYLALADIAGIDPRTLNAEGKTQAGTAPKASVDIQKFLADRGSKEKEYQTAYNTLSGDQGALSKEAFELSGMPIGKDVAYALGKVGGSPFSVDEIRAMTPKQIETQLLPVWDNYASQGNAAAAKIAAGLRKSLEMFGAKYGANQTAKRAK